MYKIICFLVLSFCEKKEFPKVRKKHGRIFGIFFSVSDFQSTSVFCLSLGPILIVKSTFFSIKTALKKVFSPMRENLSARKLLQIRYKNAENILNRFFVWMAGLSCQKGQFYQAWWFYDEMERNNYIITDFTVFPIEAVIWHDRKKNNKTALTRFVNWDGNSILCTLL